MSTLEKINRHLTVYKIVLAGFLVGWFIKLPVFLWAYINQTTVNFPLKYELFPSFFESPTSSRVFYFLPLLTITLFFIKLQDSKNKSFVLFKIASFILLLCSLVLMLHSNTYNDATFVSSFWVSIWLLWFSWHMHSEENKFRLHACHLALCLVSMIFLGGFIGKCTREWWNGEVMFGIMNSFFTHWPFSWIKNNLTFEQLRDLTKYMSWGIIMIEFVLATSFLWPKKWVLRIAPFLILGIVFFRTWRILSVLSCIIMLLWACVLLLPKLETEEEELPES
jgi:hypothetical protein